MNTLDRRTFLVSIPVALAACSAGAERSTAQESTAQATLARGESAELPEITVYKTPTCGCCGAWVDHLRADGLAVRVVEVDDTSPVALRLGVPDDLRSCHTAEIDGYAIEGHVPASDIRRLIAERPDAAGLSVPGMPVGSPGMELGDRRERYDVVLFDRDGASQVFSSH